MYITEGNIFNWNKIGLKSTKKFGVNHIMSQVL